MPKGRSIDPLLDRIPSRSYNCLDFAIDAWIHLSGDEHASEKLRSLCDRIRIFLSAVRGFKKLSKASSPCFVIMQKTRTDPHVGIFVDGRILHLIESGVEFQPIQVARRYFSKIGFYTYAD